jgi:hypothetical protein
MVNLQEVASYKVLAKAIQSRDIHASPVRHLGRVCEQGLLNHPVDTMQITLLALARLERDCLYVLYAYGRLDSKVAVLSEMLPK